MLHGSREAVLRKVQPISVHGQISLDVHFVYPDDDTEQVRVARIGPEAPLLCHSVRAPHCPSIALSDESARS